MLDFDCVGVPGRSVSIACALALALVPAAGAATRDLSVRVSRFTVPARLASGKTAKFSVRYVVKGPAARRATATVVLELNNKNNRYTVTSVPARVRPAIWRWDVADTLPGLGAGSYRATATITLRRSGKAIFHTTRATTVSVS